jgi:hypothetical protein
MESNWNKDIHTKKKALKRRGSRMRMKKGKAEKDSKREREVVVP